MDSQVVVKKISKIIKEMGNLKGHFSLAMLVPIDFQEMDTTYSLVLSAKWLDSQSPKQAITSVASILKEKLDEKDFLYISRINIIKSTDGFVQLINSAFKVQNSIMNINNCTINGIPIERAIIFESNRVD